MIDLRHRQGGGATLVVVMILLFSTSIAVFYLNRNLIFDQKSSANQVRASAALEAADAGMEWATGMLNRDYDVQGNCTFDTTTTNISFSRKYVQINYANAANIANHTELDISTDPTRQPGCYISGSALTCSCPGAGNAVLTPPSALPGFTVSFDAVAGTTDSVQVTSVGCNAISGPCTSSTALAVDATATVKAILKLQPLLRGVPGAALTCGRNCDIGGSFSVTNTDSATNGITINAGSAVTGSAGAVTSAPGMPAANSVIASDGSLSGLAGPDATCSSDSVFKAYFGSTLEQYKKEATSISCSSASDCGSKITTAYDPPNNVRLFYFPDGLDLNNSSGFSVLGSRLQPVSIVSEKEINLNGNIEVWGLVFSNNGNYGGSGNSQIKGALVTCEDFHSNGNGNVTYDADALKNLQKSSAIMVRVPGSWRDF